MSKLKKLKDIESDRELIDSYGGATKLAKKINYEVPRVQNWKKRGIPPGEKLNFPELFLRKEKASYSAA